MTIHSVTVKPLVDFVPEVLTNPGGKKRLPGSSAPARNGRTNLEYFFAYHYWLTNTYEPIITEADYAQFQRVFDAFPDVD